jgi:LRR receptor-like serine/threonine-protein kinase FLS2
VLGGVTVLAIVGVLVWRRVSSRLKSKLQASQDEVNQFRKAWEIDWSELGISARIGRGAMGEVFRGKWRGITVAVKVLRAGSCEEHMEELDREASMLRLVRHAHIVQFFGAGRHGETGAPFIVTELMELGSLTMVLRRSQLDWPTKLRFSRDIAAGMELVHSLGRMHRDLKSGNILVARAAGGHLKVKIADFGTATILSMTERMRDPQSELPENDNSYDGAGYRQDSGAGSGGGGGAGSGGGGGVEDALLPPSLAVIGATNDPFAHVPAPSPDVMLTGSSGGSGPSRVDFGGSPYNAAVSPSPLMPRREGAARAQSVYAAHTKGVGTPLWMAPEILAGERYGSSADVYSYAIVLWELAAQAVPWREVPDRFVRNELLVRIRRGDRPAIGTQWPQAFVSLLEACWATQPSARPTFHDIMARFAVIGVQDVDDGDVVDDTDDCLEDGVLVARATVASNRSSRSLRKTEPLLEFPSNTA